MTRNFFIVVCLTVAVNTGMGLIVPILPAFLKQYGYTVAGLSLPFLSLIIGRMISKSFAAYIIQTLKNKATLVVSFLLYGLTFLLYPILDDGRGFIVLRFFEGIVEGISIICLTDLAIVLSSHQRGKLMGIFGSSFGIGFILGPLIGGVCYEMAGINAVFYAGAVLGLIAAIGSLTLPSIPNVPQKKKQGWIRAAIEHSHFFPEYGPSIIRRAVFFSLMIVLPLFATEQLGVDATQVAFFFSASAVISATLMPFTGKLADKVSPNFILAITLSAMAVLIAGFGFTDNVYMFGLLFLTESLCFAFMLPAGMKVFADAVDNHPSRTVIVSAYGGVTEAITLVLAVLLPPLYALDAHASWFFLAVICLVAALPFIGRAAGENSIYVPSESET